jgi:hypothetical protein
VPLSTEYVAWYGAILATATFTFAVWRYARERPRLQVQIVTTCYEDGDVLKVERNEHGETKILADYFHVEVANIGERPTTLMGIGATSGTQGISGIGFKQHYGHRFPHVLRPGEVWSCRVRKDQVEKLRRVGHPKVELHVVHWRDPLLVPFPDGDERVIATR